MSRRVVFLALLVIALSWTAALTAAPVAASPRVSALTYAAGAVICHQRSERSFHYEGRQYPVCARCFGLYAGAAAGVLFWVAVAGLRAAPRSRAAELTRPRVVRRTLFVVALPTVVTVVASWLGWWDAGNLVRAALAVPLGAVIAPVIVAVAAGDLR